MFTESVMHLSPFNADQAQLRWRFLKYDFKSRLFRLSEMLMMEQELETADKYYIDPRIDIFAVRLFEELQCYAPLESGFGGAESAGALPWSQSQIASYTPWEGDVLRSHILDMEGDLVDATQNVFYNNYVYCYAFRKGVQ